MRLSPWAQITAVVVLPVHIRWVRNLGVQCVVTSGAGHPHPGSDVSCLMCEGVHRAGYP